MRKKKKHTVFFPFPFGTFLLLFSSLVKKRLDSHTQKRTMVGDDLCDQVGLVSHFGSMDLYGLAIWTTGFEHMRQQQ